MTQMPLAAPRGQQYFMEKTTDMDEWSCASTSVGDEAMSLEEVTPQCSQTSQPARIRPMLVWCHEKCHKRESIDIRGALAKVNPLVCLKKANKFASWCHRSEDIPYILLTDWREVKPCYAYSFNAERVARPLLTIILCDDPEAKVFSRAVTWARSLGAHSETVHVVQDLASALTLIQALNGDESLVRRLPSLRAASKSSSMASAVTPCHSLTDFPRRQPGVLAQRLDARRVPLEAATPAPQRQVPRPNEVTAAWVQQKMAPFGRMSPVEIEQLLMAAAPTQYKE